MPPGGFQDPSRLRVDFYTMEPDTRRLPSASTCGLVLMLPRGVQDAEQYDETMTFAIQNTEGFGPGVKTINGINCRQNGNKLPFRSQLFWYSTPFIWVFEK